MKKILLALALLFAPAAAQAANCSGYSYTLTNGTTADASQVMSNFNTILGCANNNLANSASGVNSNITSFTQGVAFGSTLSATGAVTFSSTVTGAIGFTASAPTSGTLGQFNAIYGSTLATLRNDGTNYYLMGNAASTTSFDSFRPFIVQLTTGHVSIDQTGAGGTTIGGALIVTGQTTSNANLQISSGASLDLYNPSGATDSKHWQINPTTTQLNFYTNNDAQNSPTIYLQAIRSGNTITNVNFPNGTIAVSNNATVGGTLNVTGQTALAGVSGSNGVFTGTLNVSGQTTLAGVSGSNGVLTGTLNVSGQTTLAGMSATAGTIIGALSAGSFSGAALASASQTLTGSSTTQAITPAGFAGNSSIANPGYYKLPGGLIMAWGTITTSGSATVTLTLPATFTNASSYTVTFSQNGSSGGGAWATTASGTRTTTTVGVDGWSASAARAAVTFDYHVIGY